jgi:hypothetical protein
VVVASREKGSSFVREEVARMSPEQPAEVGEAQIAVHSREEEY